MIPPFALVLTAAGSSTRFSKNQKEAVKKDLPTTKIPHEIYNDKN